MSIGFVKLIVQSQGMDVFTTIDRQIQHYAELALADITERFEPKGAMAVVVEVDSGDILALANAPTYNPNSVGDAADPRRNRAVQDAFEPGSVIKPFLLGAALEEDIVTPSSLVDCEGGAWYVGRSRIRDDHPHDVVTASEVIKYSSNIGTAKIALELGPEKVLDYLHLFGFGHRQTYRCQVNAAGFFGMWRRFAPSSLQRPLTSRNDGECRAIGACDRSSCERWAAHEAASGV